MRTTVTLDDALVADAKDYTGISETSALLREALTSLVQREAGRRLAALGGSMPGLKAVPRRRFATTGEWVGSDDAERSCDEDDND